MRDSVLFYRSFYDALKNIPDAERLRVYDAIMEYSMYDVDPDLDSTSLAVFLLIKPQIDANNKRYANGCKARRNQDETKLDANHNQESTKPEAKEKEKEKGKVKEKEKDKTYMCAFEALWAVYPRKQEKAKAYGCYKARLADGFSEDELLLAVKRYTEECKEHDIEKRYIKLGSTFLGSNTPFVDYLGDYKPEKPKEKKTGFSNFQERTYDMGDLERAMIQR